MWLYNKSGIEDLSAAISGHELALRLKFRPFKESTLYLDVKP